MTTKFPLAHLIQFSHKLRCNNVESLSAFLGFGCENVKRDGHSIAINNAKCMIVKLAHTQIQPLRALRTLRWNRRSSYVFQFIMQSSRDSDLPIFNSS